MKSIILICGKAGAGKNTFAKALSTFISTREYAFAKGVKDVAVAMGWDKNKDEKGRKLLQAIGAVGREYNRDVWVNNVIREIKSYEEFMEKVDDEQLPVSVITDFRFPNEYEAMVKAFPTKQIITVKVIGRAYDLGVNANDVSETSLQNFTPDYVISNEGSMEALTNNASSFAQILGG